MESKNNKITCFPKTYFSVDQKLYKSMKKRMRDLYHDIDFLTKISSRKTVDDDLQSNKKRKKSIFYKINLDNKERKFSTCKTSRKSQSNIELQNIKLKGKKNLISKKENKSQTFDSSRRNIYYKNINKNYPVTHRNNLNFSYFKNEFTKNNLQNSESKPFLFIPFNKINTSDIIKIRNSIRNKCKTNGIFNKKILKNNKIDIKKLFMLKCKKFIERINSVKKNLEEEKEKVLNKKKKNKFIKLFNNDSIIERQKLPNIKFYKEFEIECKNDTSTYQKEMGLFYRTKKTGLYTSHFSIMLRKDNYFSTDIIHKMPQYYCHVK